MIIDYLFLLPNVQWLIQDWVNSLSERRSLMILLPRQINRDKVWDTLRAELLHRDFWIEEISLLELAEPSLSSWLTQFGLDRTLNDANASAITSGCMNLPQVLYLTDFETLTLLQVKALMEELSWWARRSQSGDTPMCQMAICLIGWATPLLSCLPEDDVRIKVDWWWKLPSILDIQFLCRLVNRDKALDLISRWREDTLPTLCGNDICLLEYLWDRAHSSPQELLPILKDYAASRGWTPERLQIWGAQEIANIHNSSFISSTPKPPKELQTLWSEGALYWTPEFGFELHVAALAVLGQNASLEHRFWRGQAKLLLPLIDQLRLEFYRLLALRYGRNWPLRWLSPPTDHEFNVLQENPINVQWGHLCCCLEKVQDLRSVKRWLPLALEARGIRNELSHYRPIGFLLYEGFLEKVEQFLAATHPSLASI